MRLNHKLLFLLIFFAYSFAGVSAAHAAQGDDTDKRALAANQAMKSGMASGECVPPRELSYGANKHDPYDKTTLSYELVLSALGRDLLLCALSGNPGYGARELIGCWRRDAQTARFSPQAQTFAPGYNLTGNACRQFGYCRPDSGRREQYESELITQSLDGTHVAVVETGAGRIAVYDAQSRKFLREIAYRGEGLGRGAIGNAPVRAFYVDDTLFVQGSDAGPFSTVHRFRTNGEQDPARGPIYADQEGTFNVDDGEVRIRDAMHLVARDRGYAEVISNAANGNASIRRLPRPAVCTPEQFHAAATHVGYNENDPNDHSVKEIGMACLKAIRQAKERFWKPIEFVHQGLTHQIVGDGNRRRLVSRDLKTGTPAGTRALPVCVSARPAARRER